MKNFIQNTIALVGLDLSEMDDHLLRYLVESPTVFAFKELIFLHNIKIEELPEEYQSVASLEKIASGIKRKITQAIERVLPPEWKIKIVVTMENFSELAFLQQAKQNQVNLLMLGNKQDLDGNGGLPQKLVRMIPDAATLLIPETFNPEGRQLLGAIDFSKYSQSVNRVGQALELLDQRLQYVPVHVVKVSWPLFVGLNNQLLAESLAEEILVKESRWAKKYPAFPPLSILKARDKNIASVLLQQAKQTNSKMIILGVKGATSLTGLFLGGVANELIQRPTNCCVLFIKLWDEK